MERDTYIRSLIVSPKPKTQNIMKRVAPTFILIHETHIDCLIKLKREKTCNRKVFNIFYVPLFHIHRFMQQLEDALNISLCGHLLIMLATMCFSAFSVVTVQYMKSCML